MFSPDQEVAVRRIKQEAGPFFLTGPAGSGKSFVINHLRSDRGTVVTATTGMAAQLIHGRTLHSFAGIHPHYGVVPSRKANNRVRFCNMLIVDEISMASSILLEQIFDRFDDAEAYPKLLVVGDFLQLPPVDGEYAFKSKLWGNFTKLYLTTNHRQSDSSFLGALNDLRLGNVSDRLKALIEARKVQSLPMDCTQLFAYKNQVEDTNMGRLMALDGKAVCSRWEVSRAKNEEDDSSRYASIYEDGDDEKVKDVDKLREIAKKQARFPEELVLKVGARIVMLTNNIPDDHKDPIWVNGSTGKVVAIGADSVSVELDNGRDVTVTSDEEEIIGPNGKVQAVVRQMPMMLAWALTIHKAQGMTLDRVGVDLSGHFERGQTYVALSRCRSKEGLYLTNELAPITVDQEALAVCGEAGSHKEGELASSLWKWDGPRKKKKKGKKD